MLMNKEQMFAEYYGLIMYLAKSYYKKTLPNIKRVLDVDDLFMEGVIGAIKAINTFNEDKGKHWWKTRRAPKRSSIWIWMPSFPRWKFWTIRRLVENR